VIVLGVVLLIIGAALVYFGRPREQALVVVGALIAIGGAILFVIGLLDRADTNTAALPLLLVGGVVGGDHLHAAHDTEESHPVSGGGLADRRPVLLGFVVAATPVVCAFVLQVLEATDVLNNALWIRTALTGLGALVGTLAALWAQSKVTPVVLPQTDEGEPLVPVSDPIITGIAPPQAPKRSHRRKA
jgi:hypothetical protein